MLLLVRLFSCGQANQYVQSVNVCLVSSFSLALALSPPRLLDLRVSFYIGAWQTQTHNADTDRQRCARARACLCVCACACVCVCVCVRARARVFERMSVRVREREGGREREVFVRV